MAKSAPTDRKQVASDNGVLALTGAEILLKALESEGVEVIFGYPGGAVLPIYDALFKNNKIRHILVRHEQAAVHAAEGLCAVNWQGWRCSGDIWSRSNQCGDRLDGCTDGLSASRMSYRTGANASDW